jgi:protein-L-isoaspartate(D-aspartate) O-methyltransferase
MQEFWAKERKKMVKEQIVARGIHSEELLQAMLEIPRHLFVSAKWQAQAYQDRSLPIDCAQTISQPYIVALMTNELLCCNRKKVLEVGTGCAYQSAILSKFFESVFTLERVGYLHKSAKKTIQKLNINNIYFYHKDGYQGLATEAPFDAILVSCAAENIPQDLYQQLAVEGKMVIPLGKNWQELMLIQKVAQHKIKKKNLGAVSFVPMLTAKK